MKIFIRNIKFLVLVLTFVACAPKAEFKPPASDLKTSEPIYTPKNHDREIQDVQSESFNIKKLLGIDQSQRAQTPWLINSVEIFNMAERAMELGNYFQNEEQKSFKQFGHNLLRLFYSKPENTTRFDKHHTQYLPAALGFEDDKIKASIAKIGDPKNVPRVEETFKKLSIQWPQETPTLKPALFIQSIEDYLFRVADDFKDQGVTKPFINKYLEQVHRDYIGVLDQGKTDLKDINENQKLKKTVRTIKQVLGTLTFIPEKIIETLIKGLDRAIDYANLLEVGDDSQSFDMTSLIFEAEVMRQTVDQFKNETNDKLNSNVTNIASLSTGATESESLEVRLVKVIARIWLDLTPEKRAEYFKPVSQELFDEFSKMSESRLRALAGYEELGFIDKQYQSGIIKGLGKSCHPFVYEKLTAWMTFDGIQKTEFMKQEPRLFNLFSLYTTKELKEDILPLYSKNNVFENGWLDGAKKKAFVAGTNKYCFFNVNNTLDRTVNKYVLQELDRQIRTVGGSLEAIVKEKTLKGLNDIIVALSDNKKFEAYFEEQAMKHPLVGKLFDQETLHGLEETRVSLYIGDQEKFFIKNNEQNNFQTGAKTLGASLAANAVRMQELTGYEVLSPKDTQYYKIVFSQINKMLTMIGFKDMDHSIIPSTSRAFFGGHSEMDIFRYDCTPEKLKRQDELRAQGEKIQWSEDCSGATDFNDDYFATPDQLAIEGAFLPKDGVYTKYASAVGQAEIVRGASLMLKYFKDWKGYPDEYDQGMGAEKFGEDVVIFPRGAFVNLTVGLSTAPIRNFKKKQSPVALFRVDGTPIPEGEIPKDLSGIVQAAITDISQDGRGDVITMESLASYMLALEQFLQATDGISKTAASVVNPPDKQSRDVLHAILEGRNQIKMLLFGMANFMIQRLQATDGGFYHSYSLKNMKVKVEPKTLQDQIFAIRGLMSVARIWQSDIIKFGALEAYFYMNQKLWNSQDGFYYASELHTENVINPVLFFDVLSAVGEIMPALSGGSLAQAQKIFNFYSNKFLDWNKSSQPLTGIY